MTVITSGALCENRELKVECEGAKNKRKTKSIGTKKTKIGVNCKKQR